MTIPTPDTSAAAVKPDTLERSASNIFARVYQSHVPRGDMLWSKVSTALLAAGLVIVRAADWRDRTASHAQLVETVERLTRKRDNLRICFDNKSSALRGQRTRAETAESAAARLREALQWAAATFDDYTHHASAKICRDAALASASPPDAGPRADYEHLRVKTKHRFASPEAIHEGIKELAEQSDDPGVKALAQEMLDAWAKVAPPDGKESE